MKWINTLMCFFLSALLLSCSKAGLQGTTLPSKFKGVESAVAISPTAVRLSWSLQARFKEYRIYRKGISSPIKIETFASTVISGLSPGLTYEFAVVGVEIEDGSEVGIDNMMVVKTFENFTPIPSSGVIAQSNGAVEVNWFKNGDNANYKVFVKLESEQWDFTKPHTSVVGKSLTSLTNLASGTKYCFWVIASYEDGTSQPENQTAAYVNGKAPCVLVQAQLANLPSVKINMGFVGNFPWFWSENGDTSYKTEIFERYTDLRVGSISGNGYFRSLLPISPGKKDLYAKVSAPSGTATIVNVRTEGVGPFNMPLVRALSGADAKDPVIPRLVNGGLGQQNLGSNSVVGDFNCDGLPDVAVSAPKATPKVDINRYSATGAVVVYYSYDPPLQDDGAGGVVDPLPYLYTDATPVEGAKFPYPQLIYYPATASDMQLGKALAIGNVNGDCFARYEGSEADPDPKAMTVDSCDYLLKNYLGGALPKAKIEKVHTCDDLAMMSGDGSVVVAFGDPVAGLVSGSGGTSYGVNELTCNPSSSKCRPVKIQDTNTQRVHSIVLGDFNNDGYDDLAMSISAITTGAREVHILRGSGWGVTPVTASDSHAKITALGLNGDTSKLTDGIFAGSPLNYGANDDFGYALGVAFNSRVCVNNSPAGAQFRTSAAPKARGYDFEKCDDLVIGVPNRASGRGSILTCKGVNPTSGTDKQRITGWACQESYPDMPASGEELNQRVVVKRYGASILGVKNQNGYPLWNITGTVNNTPNIAGALFVGAPDSKVLDQDNAGAIFGYYMTPLSNSYSLGGIQGILGAQHVITAANAVACNSRNRNVATGSLLHCDHQLIHMNPSEAGVRFGTSISSIMNKELPSVAVSAPYRSVKSSDGKVNIGSHGVVYVFGADLSRLGTEPIAGKINAPQLTDDVTDSCSNNCTWYSGGLNPFGASLIYPRDLSSGSYFGLGLAAGGNFLGNDQDIDLLVGAPNVNLNAYNNGGLYLFKSTAGKYASTVTVADKVLGPNISKELNYQFEHGKVVGDVNGDGYDDVMTHISKGDSYEVILYYGGPNGLITTPDAVANPTAPNVPTLISVDLDQQFGKTFHQIGSVNGDAYDDLLIMGSNGSYLFYGSSSGVVLGNPTVNPVGKNPLLFARTKPDASGQYISFHEGELAGTFSLGELEISEFQSENRGVTFGDFNFDGYSDMAISLFNNITPPVSEVPGDAAGIFSALNVGRVVVIYGGANGPQTNRSLGYLNLKTSGGGKADVVVADPCTEAKPKQCYVQILASKEGIGGYFGWSAVGVKSLDRTAGDDFDELLIGDPLFSSNSGRAYLYKGTGRGLEYLPKQTLAGSVTGEYFGHSLASLGDVNKDDVGDIAVSGPRVPTGTASSIVYVFYGANIGGVYAFYGASGLDQTDYFDPANSPLAVNKLHQTIGQPKPQRIQPSTFVKDDHFGYGLAAFGDANLDSYTDLVVNAPAKTYDADTNAPGAGAFVAFYGSENGLLIEGTPSLTPRCYKGSSPVCEPSLVFLPDVGSNEYSYLSDSPLGDIDGNGVPDLLMASPGRSHPSGKAYSTGVIYVLY